MTLLGLRGGLNMQRDLKGYNFCLLLLCLLESIFKGFIQNSQKRQGCTVHRGAEH